MEEAEAKAFIAAAINVGSETPKVEFKEATYALPKDIWQSISAFAHQPNGGLIAFGYQEDRQARTVNKIGVGDVAVLQEGISNMVNNEFSIVLRPLYFSFEEDGLRFLIVYIPQCPDQHKPCYYKPQGVPHGAYIRDANTNRKITDDEMRRFVLDARLPKFDATQAPNTTLEDISTEKVFNLITRTSDRTQRIARPEDVDFDLLKNLGIADVFGNQRLPTVAGFLVFAREKPQLRSPFDRYLIRCVAYSGSNVSTDIIDKSDLNGTLNEQIDQMFAFVLRNIKRSAQIVGSKRIDRYEYPEKAIREIVANAVIHRDYHITGTYTQINIFADRIEVFNPGCLPPGVTVDNLRDAQLSRNETIAARLKDLDYLEEYGRGIDIVFNSMQEWNLLPPIFKNSTNSFKVILPGMKLSSLNDRQVAIWTHLAEHNRVTAGDCENLLPDVSRQTINNDLTKMQEHGLIRSVGVSRSTYYISNF